MDSQVNQVVLDLWEIQGSQDLQAHQALRE